MAVQNSLARQDQSMKLSVYLQNDAVKKQINQVVGGKNGTRFISSIVSAVQSTPALQECTSPKQRKEMKWIPTIERLPDQREFIESYVRSAYAAEFLVTIEGADKATTLYYSQTGVWFDEQGEPYKVVAWMPLPERYKG